MGRRNDIDWDAVQKDFRLGQLTLRQIAKNHKISASAISRKFSAPGKTAADAGAHDQALSLYRRMGEGRAAERAIERMALMFCVNHDICEEMSWPEVVEIRRQVDLGASRADVVLCHIDGSVTLIEVKNSGLSLREYCTGIGQLSYQAAAAMSVYRTLDIRRVLCLPGPVPRELVKAAYYSDTDLLPVPSLAIWNSTLQEAAL